MEITPLRAEAAEKRAMNDFLDSTERRRRSRLANMQKGTFESEVLSKLSKLEEQFNTGGGGSAVTLATGATARVKLLAIAGDPTALAARLAAAGGPR